MADEDSCLVCTEAINVRPHSLLLKCGHRWCRECISRGFDLACREEQSFPPRCCDRITLQDALPFLRPDLVDQFRQREQELCTNDPLYCHRPSCQQILLRTVKTVHCFACGSITCAECKEEGHEGLCTNRDDEGFKAAVSAAGFQQCRRCKRMVEKSGGCNHITCLCHFQFCYKCGLEWNTCFCIQDEGWPAVDPFAEAGYNDYHERVHPYGDYECGNPIVEFPLHHQMLNPAPYHAAPGGEWWGVLTDMDRRVEYCGIMNEGTAVGEVPDTVQRTGHDHLPEDELAEGGYSGNHQDVRTPVETLPPHQIVIPLPYRMAPDRELWDNFADIDPPRGVFNEHTAVGGTLATVYRSGRDHSPEDESRAIHPGTGTDEYRHDHQPEDTEGLTRGDETNVYQQYWPHYLREARRQRELLREEMDFIRREQAAQIEREVEIDAYQQNRWLENPREISRFREETLPEEETDADRHDHAVQTSREVKIDAYPNYHWPEYSRDTTTPREQTEAYRRNRIAQIAREVEMLSPILRSRFDAEGRFGPRRHPPLPVRSDPAHLHDAEPRPEPRATRPSTYDCIPRPGIPTDPMPGHPHWPECSEGSRRVDRGPLVCDFCEQWLPNFIWLCSGCGRRECSRCRREHSARCGLGI